MSFETVLKAAQDGDPDAQVAMGYLFFKGEGVLQDRREAARWFGLAADSLVLYTDAGFKFSAGIALVMMALALVELVYTLVIFCTGQPIEGWTTTMFVLTLGFAGVFAILTVVIKYLSLLVDLVFKKQRYLIESIEKIQK